MHRDSFRVILDRIHCIYYDKENIPSKCCEGIVELAARDRADLYRWPVLIISDVTSPSRPTTGSQTLLQYTRHVVWGTPLKAFDSMMICRACSSLFAFRMGSDRKSVADISYTSSSVLSSAQLSLHPMLDSKHRNCVSYTGCKLTSQPLLAWTQRCSSFTTLEAETQRGSWLLK